MLLGIMCTHFDSMSIERVNTTTYFLTTPSSLSKVCNVYCKLASTVVFNYIIPLRTCVKRSLYHKVPVVANGVPKTMCGWWEWHVPVVGYVASGTRDLYGWIDEPSLWFLHLAPSVNSSSAYIDATSIAFIAVDETTHAKQTNPRGCRKRQQQCKQQYDLDHRLTCQQRFTKDTSFRGTNETKRCWETFCLHHHTTTLFDLILFFSYVLLI